MASYCIPPGLVTTVKNIFNNAGSSTERMKQLTAQIGEEEAQKLNLRYENAIRSVHQENSIKRFVDTLNLTPADKAEALAKVASRLANREAAMFKEELTSVIKNIIDRKYGVKLTPNESMDILKMSKAVQDELAKGKNADGNYSQAYGLAVDDLSSTISKIHDPKRAGIADPTKAMTFGEVMKFEGAKSAEAIREAKGWYQKTIEVIRSAPRLIPPDTFKTLKASSDLSFIGIQGSAILTRNPKAFFHALREAKRALFSADSQRVFRADMFAWGGYDDAVKSGLRLISPEEQLAGSLAEVVPLGVGSVVKRSNEVFSIFLMKARRMEYERVMRNWEELRGSKFDINVPADAKKMKEVAAHANKVSGTSNLGSQEKYASGLNQILFAARYAVSDIRNFTDIGNPALSSQARALAARTLGANVGIMYGGYYIYALANPDNTELNPNAANFMKIQDEAGFWSGPKLKGQWLIQLTAKMIQQEEKSARGKITKYGEGYRAKEIGDAWLRTLRGKLAPIPAAIVTPFAGKTFENEEPTFLGELKNLAAPISAGDTIEEMFKNEEEGTVQLKNAFLNAIGYGSYKIGR